MQATAPDWLDREVIVCLEEKCGTLVDAVLIAYASGSVGDELHSLGVRDLSTFGGADVYVPERRERVVWARVIEYHGCSAQQPQSELRRQEAPRQRGGDKSRGTVIPAALVEAAVLAHERDGSGRRTLAAIPGLTEWTAGKVLRWYSVGKPAGLWLDEHGKLQWGAAISRVSPGEQGWEQRWEQDSHATSPTPVLLRLPRI